MAGRTASGYGDLEATLIVHAMWQYGIMIPAELSVIGFNDIFAARYMIPALTIVGFDAMNIGELGARLVLKEIGATEGKRIPAVLTV